MLLTLILALETFNMLTKLKELQCFKQDLEAADSVIQWCKHKSNPTYACIHTAYPLVLTGFITPNLNNEHATTICC